MNLAIEEYLFRNENDDVIMLWQNGPSVIIGRNQNPYTEVDISYLKQHGIKLARRITGGGAVYHDLGNVNYTFISKHREGCAIDFEYFTAPVIKALAALGVTASLNGRNDLVLPTGEKFSGNAQHTEKGRTLHHGTLMFDTDREVLSSVLTVDPEKLRSKAIASVSARTGNLASHFKEQISVGDFIRLLSEFFIVEFSPTLENPPDNEQINTLYARNSSAEWLYPDKDIFSSYTVKKKKRFPFGTVSVHLSMKKDIIKAVKIEGDFFGNRDIRELEAALSGISREALEKHFSCISISDYIFGMNASDLISLLI